MSGTRRSARSPFVVRDALFDETDPIGSFTGGMRYGYTGVASWSVPLVTLDIYPSGLELRSTFSFLRFLVPTWRARYEAISAVHWMGRPTPDTSVVPMFTMVRGVRFTTTDGGWVIFWCRDRDRLVATLATFGLNIAGRKRFNYFNPRA